MAYDFKDLKTGIKSAEDWLKTEFSGIRTGRATPALLDSVMVEAYGSMMPINQVGSISVEDARMMRVSPWDMSLAKAVEKAIMLADLGLSLAVDEKGVRISFPDLTADRRTSLVKIAKQRLEDSKITLRGEREKTIKDIDKKEKDGEISEDEKFRLKTELQKYIDEGGRVLEELFIKKEKEITE
ncbi:MAG: ribosome recycling factor [Minisyncoccota bacterium]